jgi:hypothetical protein
MYHGAPCGRRAALSYLSYLLFTALAFGRTYTIYGYKGNQCRDQIHSRDVVAAFDAFYRNPRCGAAYKLGGGNENSASVLECIERAQDLLGRGLARTIHPEPRSGDHVCYYTNMKRFRIDFPDWQLSTSFDEILAELAVFPHGEARCLRGKSLFFCCGALIGVSTSAMIPIEGLARNVADLKKRNSDPIILLTFLCFPFESRKDEATAAATSRLALRKGGERDDYGAGSGPRVA